MRQVTACFRTWPEAVFLLKSKTQFRCLSGLVSQSERQAMPGSLPLRKTPAQGRRFTNSVMVIRAANRRFPDPWANCASPGLTSRDNPSTSTVTDRCPNVGRAVLALSISSGDTAAIHPHHSLLALYCPASRLWRWGLARHPYRSCPATSSACYLTCLCSVNPLHKG